MIINELENKNMLLISSEKKGKIIVNSGKTNNLTNNQLESETQPDSVDLETS